MNESPGLAPGLATPAGIEWVVDATGCDPEALRDALTLDALFAAILAAARLTPVAPATWHRFPHPGGLTGLQVLAESHLACHTFPEHGSLCLNVFCCVARPDWDLDGIVRRLVAASDVRIRRIERVYGSVSGSAEFRMQNADTDRVDRAF